MKDKPKEKKGGNKDKETESHKKERRDVKADKKTESVSAGQATVTISTTQKDDNEQKAKVAAVTEAEKPDKQGGAKASEDVQNKEVRGNASSATTGKKKIIKKVIKQKIGAERKQVTEDPTIASDKMELAASQQDESLPASGDGFKTFARKKVVKNVTMAKKESPSTPQKKAETEAEGSKTDSGVSTIVQDATVKKKKKIIKKVLKKKASSGGDEAKNGVDGDATKDGDEDVKTVVSEAKTTTAKLEDNKMSLKSVTLDKSSGSSAITQSKGEKDKVGGKKGNEKTGNEEKEKSKDEVRKDQKEKDDPKNNVKKEVKENKKPEESPRHPGLFLQTKGDKDSRLRSVSLSLDSLLDYTDKDTDESTFEISLFAESLQEMLQYEMGCRLLTFLQKLRLKFVMKRNQHKRKREEVSRECVKESSIKRLKTDEDNVGDKSIKTETDEVARADDGKSIVKGKVGNSTETGNVKQGDETENVKQEEETTDVDDPEEDPEEDEEMLDGNPQHDLANDENESGEKIESDIKVKMEVDNTDNKKQDTTKENADSKSVTGSACKENEDKVEKKKETVADKKLLEAFRFFDRSRVGYIRVEDMRLIVHNLGKFLSHRDVKELVQSALLESNTGRDDRILYPKLVRIADI